MTSTLPFRGRSAGGVAPVARLSESTLRANALVAASATPDDPLAADAWGHGERWVSAVLADLGRDAASLDAATLYGLPGSPTAPVMSLRGRALGTKPLLRGEGVSYGYTHRAARDTRVALVTGGYAQGVVRSLGDRADVWIGGGRHRIVGRVAMDVCVVDVGDADIPRGAEAVFFGDPRSGHPSLREWVDATGFTAGEIVAIVGARAERQVVS